MATVLAPSQSPSPPMQMDVPPSQEPEIVGEYAVFRGVPIFDEHAIEEADPSNPQQKRVVRYGRPELEAIAANNNQRYERTGDRCPITIGHTHPDPRVPSPELVGFLGNCTVAPFRGRYAIHGDLWIFQDDLPKVRKNPRRSVEVIPEPDPRNRWFDPIALLGAETPRRDLGMLYSLEGEKVLYSHASIADDRIRYGIWDESLHPRGEGGKWSTKEGADKGGDPGGGSGKQVQRGMFGEDFEPKKGPAKPKAKPKSSEKQGQLWTGLDQLPGQRDFMDEAAESGLELQDTAANEPSGPPSTDQRVEEAWADDYVREAWLARDPDELQAMAETAGSSPEGDFVRGIIAKVMQERQGDASQFQQIQQGDRERKMRELGSDLADLVESGDITDQEANEWAADKADQWSGDDPAQRAGGEIWVNPNPPAPPSTDWDKQQQVSPHSDMSQMISDVLANTSPAEMRQLQAGDIETAKWLAMKTMAGLTDSQGEAVAQNIVDRVQGPSPEQAEQSRREEQEMGRRIRGAARKGKFQLADIVADIDQLVQAGEATHAEASAFLADVKQRYNFAAPAVPSGGNTFVPGSGKKRQQYANTGAGPMEPGTPSAGGQLQTNVRIDPVAMQQIVDVVEQLLDAKISERLQDMGPDAGINQTVEPAPVEPTPGELDPMNPNPMQPGDPLTPTDPGGIGMAPELDPMGNPALPGAAAMGSDMDPTPGAPPQTTPEAPGALEDAGGISPDFDTAPPDAGEVEQFADSGFEDDEEEEDDRYGLAYMRYMMGGDTEGAQTFTNDLQQNPQAMRQLHRYMQYKCSDEAAKQHYMTNCGQYQTAPKTQYSRSDNVTNSALNNLEYKIRYERASAELQQLRERVAALEAQNFELQAKERYSFYSNELRALQDEGVILNLSEEMQYVETAKMDRDAFDAHKTRIKQHYQRRPPSELIPTGPPNDGGSVQAQGMPAQSLSDAPGQPTETESRKRIEEVSAARAAAKCQYARQQKQVFDFAAILGAETEKVNSHFQSTGELLSEVPDEVL